LGGWRIVHTMGSKITRLHPVQGFCAEAGGAITLFLATFLGIPGVGAARKVAAVRWNVASNVVFAWIVTLPATALFGSVFYELGSVLF
jgi:PiT family inorganic phosphate transporter